MHRNVLHLVDSFNTGGSERQAVQLVRLLSESGRYSVHVACLNSDGILADEAKHCSSTEVQEYRLSSFYDCNMARQLRRFARFLQEREIQIVHTHDFYTNIFGMLGSRIAGTPVRLASRRETTGIRTDMQKRMERFSYKLAHAVVANAGAVKDQLTREGVPGPKIEVIYNGVTVDPATDLLPIERNNILAGLGLPIDRPLVTLVANMRLPVKDHPTFLRAARRVKDGFTPAAFVLAGDGPLTGEIRSLTEELGLGADVFFTGTCTDVAGLLAVSKIGVLSSRAEGFSNSILEYMAASLPVVVTDVGGAREAVIEGQTGYIVPPGDDAAMADRIIGLLRDPESAQRIGEAGRNAVERGFSCSVRLARTEELYDRLLDPARGLIKAAGDWYTRKGIGHG
jgi:glycosyltransferase involved in cell wall biosynthesis